MGVKRLYSVFETCFAPSTDRCWEQNTSQIQILGPSLEKGSDGVQWLTGQDRVRANVLAREALKFLVIRPHHGQITVPLAVSKPWEPEVAAPPLLEHDVADLTRSAEPVRHAYFTASPLHLGNAVGVEHREYIGGSVESNFDNVAVFFENTVRVLHQRPVARPLDCKTDKQVRDGREQVRVSKPASQASRMCTTVMAGDCCQLCVVCARAREFICLQAGYVICLSPTSNVSACHSPGFPGVDVVEGIDVVDAMTTDAAAERHAYVIKQTGDHELAACFSWSSELTSRARCAGVGRFHSLLPRLWIA